MNKSWKSICWLFLKMGVVIVLLYFLYNSINIKNVWNTIKNINLMPIIFYCIIIWPLTVIVLALRQKVSLKVYGINVNFLTLCKSIYAGAFANNFLPSGLGNDIAKYFHLQNSQKNEALNKLKSAIVYDRFMGLIANFIVVCIGGSFILLFKPFNNIVCMVTLFCFFCLIIVFFLYKIIDKLPIPQIRYLKELWIFIKHFFLSITQVKKLVLPVLISIFVILLSNFGYYMYFLAINSETSLLLINILMPFVSISEMVPITINSIGVRETVSIYFFENYGIIKEEILSVMLLTRFVSIILSLPGAIFILKK